VEFGSPLGLERSGGWLLERRIPASDDSDAMGCYPLFTCAHWAGLKADLDELAGRLVSVVMVVDPFAPVQKDCLTSWFDVVVPFKDHFVVDMSRPAGRHGSAHHRYRARKALKELRVELVPQRGALLDDWLALYGVLVRRHGLTGIRAFSRSSFALQFEIPSMVCFRALHGETTVGAQLWFVESGVAFSHLVACNEDGYRLGAAYALHLTALQTFAGDYAGKVRWADLGAAAGTSVASAGGLARFKRGWASGTRPAYLCGRILQRERYEELASRTTATSYFPAYRAGEFR
jgi:hypothetical protein